MLRIRLGEVRILPRMRQVASDQFDSLIVVRHRHVLEDIPKPSELCRLSGRNGGQFSDEARKPLNVQTNADPSANTKNANAPAENISNMVNLCGRSFEIGRAHV